ncbi:GNAT family N-acetyltransferase [Asticcacaulis sp. ZE23SCel15]|uniref:GNAT family N-acetyltransferase n=1 Tax=Asticcacaulis sp. ZE23SCel15 TaxID=3059027 RepID=UPI00265FBACF|nr:GNAT family N-acetyltransferase [Asticcacaulis sp. ZE23SCel15]WKL55856.1 GNAT family N-acetyltransferase [Asticcacaulis sp. ZE23SCel15]
MTITHPLDRPVWSALNSGWAHLAHGDDRALKLDPAFGPFAASFDGSPEPLAALTPGPDGFWVVEKAAISAPAGFEVVKLALCHQMTATHITPGGENFEAVELTHVDGPEMLALARLTQPGPFAERTNELSAFIGIKHDGRLVAMAGERMKIDGFSEVSGVCTHPDFRGRGYAAGLMRLVARRILARGETAFLHTYADNQVAIDLYKSLGFEYRASLVASVLRPVISLP